MNQLVLPSAKSFPVEYAWLNKRHCDVLQGLDKAETAARLDDAHVKIWRRACITSLSPLEKGDPQPGTDNVLDADLGPSKFIKTEGLQDTPCFLTYWHERIALERGCLLLRNAIVCDGSINTWMIALIRTLSRPTS